MKYFERRKEKKKRRRSKSAICFPFSSAQTSENSQPVK